VKDNALSDLLDVLKSLQPSKKAPALFAGAFCLFLVYSHSMVLTGLSE
jgi:hypothetical protein